MRSGIAPDNRTTRAEFEEMDGRLGPNAKEIRARKWDDQEG